MATRGRTWQADADESTALHRWGADEVRDDLQQYVAEHLGSKDGILIIDETGFLTAFSLGGPSPSGANDGRVLFLEQEQLVESKTRRSICSWLLVAILVMH